MNGATTGGLINLGQLFMAGARMASSAEDFLAACKGPDESLPETAWPISQVELLIQEHRDLHIKALELGLKDPDPDATTELLATVEEFIENLRRAMNQAKGEV